MSATPTQRHRAVPKPSIAADAGLAPSTRTDEDLPEITFGVLSTWLQAWTNCHTTVKQIEGYAWVPKLSLVSALLSAVTGTAIFATLQDDVGTPARVAVATVAVVAALMTAAQTWVAGQVKSLSAQEKALHQLHRRILSAIEASKKTPITATDAAAWDAEMSTLEDTIIHASTEQFEAEWAARAAAATVILKAYKLPVPADWPKSTNAAA